MKRFFTGAEMNVVSNAFAYSRHDIAHAVGEHSEMVDGGYVAELSAQQVVALADAGLPTGRLTSAEQAP